MTAEAEGCCEICCAAVPVAVLTEVLVRVAWCADLVELYACSGCATAAEAAFTREVGA